MTGRTVVVGFDGLDFEYLDAFASSLPNFAALREAGVEAPLRSTFPPWTGSAWPSMYTGTDPSHHGVYGFFHHGDAYRGELATRTHVQRPAIWNYLTAVGKPTIALNVPVTHPAEPVEGVLVPGYLAHEDDPGYPEGVREEISEAVGEPYRIYSSAETSDDGADKRAGYLDLLDLRGRAAAYLLETYDWQVAVVQVQKTDAAFHNFDDRKTFRQVYERADELLGRVRDAAGDANVVVCSDHGMGRVDGYSVYVNEVLRDHGLVETDADAANPDLTDEKPALTGDDGSDADRVGRSATGRVVSAGETALDAVGITTGDVYGLAHRLGVADLLTSVVPDSAIAAVGVDVDRAASAAYARCTELGVRVNLEGREPEGVVPPGEYEAVRDEVIAALSSLRTPDGDPAFEWVRRCEEVYDGPHADDACDVLFAPTGMNHVVKDNLVGRQFVPIEAHDHQRDGVFIGAGPAFGRAGLDRLSLTDVAPIALAAAGCAVPERMTGTVPDGLIDRPTSRTDYGEVPYGCDTDGSDDREAMEERLSDLGYL